MNQQNERSILNRVDLNLFHVFEVIYHERNLTRAAALLNLSQSAVSHALQRLREQIDDPLFVREGRGMVPTPLARQLAPGIQEALRGLRRSLSRGQGFDPQTSRRSFTLNMPEQMEPAVLPALLAYLRQCAPHVEIHSSSLHWAPLQRELISGHIDLSIEVARPTDTDLRQRLWLSDSFCVVAGPAWTEELTAERYLAAEHVAVTSRRRGICVEDLALGHLGVVRQVRQRCLHYLSAAMLVAQSDLLLTMPRRYAGLINVGQGNRLLPMPLELPPVSLNLYWSSQAENDVGGQWLRGELLALAGGF